MFKAWRILKALMDLPDLVALHWADLGMRKHRLTWACNFKGQPARLPVIAVCRTTGRWLIEYPDGTLELISPRPVQTVRVDEPPQPPEPPTQK